MEAPLGFTLRLQHVFPVCGVPVRVPFAACPGAVHGAPRWKPGDAGAVCAAGREPRHSPVTGPPSGPEPESCRGCGSRSGWRCRRWITFGASVWCARRGEWNRVRAAAEARLRASAFHSPRLPAGSSLDGSHCGTKVPKEMSERTHRCGVCGFELDREENAARNVLSRGLCTFAGEAATGGMAPGAPAASAAR